MLALWILGGIILFLLLLCLLRVGVLITLDAQPSVYILVGLLRVQLYPSKSGKKLRKAKKTDEKPVETSEETPKKGTLPKLAFSDIREICSALWPLLKRALEHTRRGIRIKPLQLSVILGGGEDPAVAAQQYGLLSAAVWTVMPILERFLGMPDPSVHLDLDFQQEKTCVQGQLGVFIRIGTLVAIGFSVGVPALRWFLKFRKRKQAETGQAKGQPADAAA